MFIDYVMLLRGEGVGVSITPGRELFIHRKALVPYVQLSTNCGLDKLITVQILFSLYQKPIIQFVLRALRHCKEGEFLQNGIT